MTHMAILPKMRVYRAPLSLNKLRNLRMMSMSTGGQSPKAISKQEFGRRLHSILINMGWNQSDLARASGIGKDSISGYIRGRSFPGPNKLKQIADALGVPKEKLLRNSVQSALAEELPAVEVTQSIGHPDRVWLQVNRSVSRMVAARVVAELFADQEDRDD
jgi:transcriptional regulator with XRE-family HTH domain